MVVILRRLNNFIRKMSTTHLERTQNVIRDPSYSEATVKKIVSISPTVKSMQIHVDSKELTFKAGQWVDFIIPGLSTVGGYSMCSAPSTLSTQQYLDLAVKYSTHPPAHWVHNQCTDGSRVSLQVGGDCFFEAKSASTLRENLLLIAAGVGINPILSIMKQVFEEHQNNTAASASSDAASLFGKTHLLYSVTTHEELIFKEDISSIVDSDKSFSSQHFVTKQPSSQLMPEEVLQRRMNVEDLREAIEAMDAPPQEIVSYICAPAPMMAELETMLKGLGLRKENVRYESWW